MADVDSGGQSSSRKGKKSGPKMKKKSTKIDMTAMVDVAFLLLTFFVLTATMNKPSVMELVMPPQDKDKPKEDIKIKVQEEKIMTIILEKGDSITYFKGITEPQIKKTTFDPKTGIRKVIAGHITDSVSIYGPLCTEIKAEKNCWDPIFVVKPRVQSRYQNFVDIIDELNIVGAPKFAVDKYTPEDSVYIEAKLKEAAEEDKK